MALFCLLKHAGELRSILIKKKNNRSTKGRAKKIPTLDTHPLLETSTEPQTRHKIEKCDQHSRMDKASCS